MAKKRFDWTRFWVPHGERPPSNEWGFLAHPDDSIFRATGLEPFDQLCSKGCLLLLGPPGIGKSDELKTQYNRVREGEREGGSLSAWCDLKEYGTEDRMLRDLFENEKFDRWKAAASEFHLFVDGLDECRVSQYARLLLKALGEMSDEARSRLRLRMGCRSAEVPGALLNELGGLWPEGQFLACELSPLTGKDIQMAAEESGLDGRGFMESLIRTGAQPFAESPLTLRFLIDEFRSALGLPASRHELFRRGCERLCSEMNPDRLDAGNAGSLLPQARMRIAARVALIMILSGKKAVFFSVGGEEPATQDFPLHLLTLGNGDNGAATDRYSQSELRETLETALFRPWGDHRFGIAHQAYAEFLAAQALLESGRNVLQARRLFWAGEEPHRRIVPQLKEVAAWLAVEDEDFFEECLRFDPMILIRGDVATLDGSRRARWVARLLETLDREDALDHWTWRPHYRSFDHPGLAEQARPYIVEAAHSVIARRAAIDISEACGLAILQDDLAKVALDTEEHGHIREQAAHAVQELGDDEHRLLLLPLARGELGSDPDDALKGAALLALWPRRLIGAAELFAMLTPRKRANHYGLYEHFLSRILPEDLKADEIPEALDWVSRYLPDEARRPGFGRLMEGALIAAWQKADEPGLLDRLGMVCAQVLESHGRLFEQGYAPTEAIETLMASRERRLGLVAAVLSHCAEPEHCAFYVAQTRLVRSEDLAEMIAAAKAEPDEKLLGRWLCMIQSIFRCDQDDHFGVIWQEAKDFPQLRKAFAWLLGPVSLGTPEAARMKADWSESEDWGRRRRELEGPPVDLIQLHILPWLDRVESSEPDQAWMVVRNLGASPRGWLDGDFKLDVRDLPGWKAADDPTRKRILSVARRYILEHKCQPDQWLGNGRLFYPDSTGFQAFYLLVREDPDWIDALPSEIWSNWTPIILGYLTNDSYPKGLAKAAYLRAADVFTESLISLIRADNERGDTLFVLNRIHECWDARLCASLSGLLTLGEIKPSCFGQLLSDLLLHGSEDARRIAELELRGLEGEADDDRPRALEATTALLASAIDGGWSAVYPVLKGWPEFGKRAVLKLVSNPMEGREPSIAARLQPEQLADYYLWLIEAFPPAEDRTEDDEEMCHWVGAGETAIRYRDYIPVALKEMGSAASVRALDRIAASRPDQKWLRWTLREARERRSTREWMPPSPEQVLRFLSEPRTRLVRNEDDLLETLIESLGRLQMKLQGETPVGRFLWNEVSNGVWQPKDEASLSDFILVHLRDDLKERGVLLCREVEISRSTGGAPSERVDIYVAVSHETALGLPPVRAIIEVKGCWNRGLKKDMRDQLVERYLRDTDCRAGLFLVGWHDCEQWDKRDTRRGEFARHRLADLATARGFFEGQADEISKEGLRIRALILDATLR